jgi:hypothetical protein
VNRKLIIFGGIGIVLIGTIVMLADFLSYRTVTFSLQGDGYEVRVLSDDDSIGTLSESGSVRVKDGEYSYRVIGDTYDDTPTPFSVEGEAVEISLNPTYSDSHLATLLISESPTIRALLATTYNSRPFTIGSLRLYDKGTWAGGVLEISENERAAPISYRYVVEKYDGTWRIVVPAQIVVNKDEYPDVPDSVIYSLYD